MVAGIAIMSNVSAQNATKATAGNYRDRLSFGAKVGFNYSNVYDRQGEEFVADPKFGLAVGGFVAIPLVKYLSFQPELLFSQKGFEGKGKLLGSTYNYKRTTSYLDIPLLIAIRPSEKVSIVLGPQYSFLLKEKNEFTSAIINSQQEKEFENDNVRKNMLGFTGGLDLNFDHIVVGLRAGWDLQKNNGDGTSTTPRYKNSWYQATIGFRF